MKRKPKKTTGWIKYRITDKSGSGWKTMKWLYAPYAADYTEKDDVIYHIIHERESWAMHAERYTIQFWQHATPPADVLKKQIKIAKSCAKAYREEAKVLTEQLAKLE